MPIVDRTRCRHGRSMLVLLACILAARTARAGVATDLSAGRSHACAVTAGGGVRCWGQNLGGALGDGTTIDRRTPVDVIGLGDVASVVTGSGHSCALTTAGGVVCWGANEYGQLGDGTGTPRLAPVGVIGLASGVAAIATDGLHTCALTTGGAVKCWGANEIYGLLGNGSSVPGSPLPVDVVGLSSGVTAIAAGFLGSCALTTVGGVKCWGTYTGDGTIAVRSTPVDVVGVSSVVAIAVGDQNACAVTAAGALKCWGGNPGGQVGDGTTASALTAVDVVGLGSGVASVAMGSDDTCALLTDGTVKCWGGNRSGGVGDGTTERRLTPVDVMGLPSDVAAVSVGNTYSCARTTAGEVRCWGDDVNGQLGHGMARERRFPVPVAGLAPDVTAIAVGRAHSCALTAAGSVACWGYNAYGQLGDGTTTHRVAPTPVAGLANVTAISGGGAHTCALTAAGGVKCWGMNGNGQLGNGTTVGSPTPVDVTGLGSGVVAISAGDIHTCALTAAGALLCWGSNLSGRLGDGTTTQRTTPTPVVGHGSGIAAVSAGVFHTCALTTGGAMRCWGSNSRGQLGDGTTTTRLTSVAVVGLANGVTAIGTGNGHSCARTAAGTVLCWGRNENGQLGDGTTTQQITPADVGALPPGGTALAVGPAGTCAVGAAGGLACWGTNASGEPPAPNLPAIVPGFATGVAAVDLGEHGCLLTTTGAVACWGTNWYGQLGNGESAFRTAPVAVVGFGQPCGDGIVDGAEACDDGNRLPEDCCSPLCALEAAGTRCAADGNVCSDDVCNGAGTTCTHPAGNAGAPCRVVNPADPCDLAEACDGSTAACPTDGSADGDHDGECDGDDPCTGGQPFASSPAARLVVKGVNTDVVVGNDQLKLTGAFDLPIGVGFGDLRPDLRGLRVVVESQSGTRRIDVALAAGLRIDGATRGWRLSLKSLTFADRSASPANGITKVKIVNRARPTSPRQVKVQMSGKKGTYPIVDGDQPLHAIVTLGDQTDAGLGICGESAFEPGDCTFDGRRAGLTCR